MVCFQRVTRVTRSLVVDAAVGDDTALLAHELPLPGQMIYAAWAPAGQGVHENKMSKDVPRCDRQHD